MTTTEYPKPADCLIASIISTLQVQGAQTYIQLNKHVGVDVRYLRKALYYLLQIGKLRVRLIKEGTKTYYVPTAAEIAEELKQAPSEEETLYLRLKVEEKTRHRLHMIKRMRDSLISSWTPLLDLVVRDYEASLNWEEELPD
jgi:hypothetical protein